MPRAKKSKKAPISIFFILDGSGSMSHLQDDVIGGLNAFIEEQKKVSVDSPFTLTVFDTRVKQVFDAKPVGEIPSVTRRETYLGGMTALLDAVGTTINDVRSKNLKGKKLVIIYTDGYENSSVEWTNEGVKGLINDLERDGDWTFTFMSADVDNFNQAQAIGIAAGNYATVEAAHVGATMRGTALSTATYSAAKPTSSKNFFREYDVLKNIEKEKKQSRGYRKEG